MEMMEISRSGGSDREGSRNSGTDRENLVEVAGGTKEEAKEAELTERK